MDASLLTIESLFVGSNGPNIAATTLPESLTKQRPQSTFEVAESNITSEEAPDNNCIESAKEVIDEPVEEDESSLEQQEDDEIQSLGNIGKKAKQNPLSKVALEIIIPQTEAVLETQNSEQCEAGVSETAQPQVSDQLVSIISNLKADELAPDAGRRVSFAGNNSILVVGTGTIDSKILTPNTTEQSIQLDKVGNAGRTQTSGEMDFAPENNTSQQSSEVLQQKVVIDADGGVISPSEGTAVANTSDASDGQKISLLGVNLLLAQNNFLQSQGKVVLGPETSSPVAEKANSNEAASFQQSRPGIQELSESFNNGDEKQKSDSSGGSAMLKTNVTGFSGAQGKDANLESDNVSNQIFERLASSNDIQNNTVGESLTSIEAGKDSNGLPLRDTTDGISKQISESIQNSLSQQGQKQQITVHLYPPELGKVCIKFNQQQDQLTGLLEVDRAQTKNEIEQVLPQIIRNLSDSGVQLKRLEVVLTDQSQQQLVKDQLMQNESFQQHYFAGDDGRHNQDAPAINEWLVNDTSYTDNPETILQYTDSSINILV